MLPVLFELPHGGNVLPSEVLPYIQIAERELRLDSDEYSDEIYKNHDVLYEIRNPYWRACFDANRLLDDFSEDGIVKKKTSQGYQVYKNPEGLPRKVREVMIEKYAKPYYRNLCKILDDSQIKAILLCHTMPACGRGFRCEDKGEFRPLFMLGNDGDQEGNPGHGSLIIQEKMIRISEMLKKESKKLSLKNVRFSDFVYFNNPYKRGSVARLGKYMQKTPTMLLEINRDIPRQHEENILVLREIVLILAKMMLDNR